jgi:hypothetical protein
MRRATSIFAIAAAGELHGAGRIDDEIGAEVGVGLEFLDVKPIRAREGLPIEAAGVVAGDVFPVLRKLHGGAAMRRAVLAGDVSQHRHPRLQRDRAEAREQFAI